MNTDERGKDKKKIRVRSLCLSVSTRKCLLAGVTSLLGGLLALGLFTLWVGHFLTVDDALSQADGIVVLGGGNSNRAQHAVGLFDQEYAPLVIFSGGTLKEVGLACSSALLSLEDAQELGLPEGAALIAPEAQSTYDEAVNVRQLAQAHGWRSLIVVTDPLHTRRAARTFRALLPGVSVTVSAAPDPRYDPARWWESEHGLVGVFNEILKLGFYWARYGIRPF